MEMFRFNPCPTTTQVSGRVSPLVEAARKLDFGSMKTLLEDGISSTSELEPHAKELLHWMSGKTCQDRPERVETAYLILKYCGGKDSITQTNKRGETCLMVAIRSRDLTMFRLFLKFGAQVNTVNSCGNAAIHLASRLSGCSVSQTMIKLLIQNGADMNLKDGNGLYPIHLAVMSFSYENLLVLLVHGADPNQRSVDGKNSTPLHLAARHNCAEMCRLLMQFNAYIDDEDSEGMTPLQCAIEYGSYEAAFALYNLGASIMQGFPNKSSALHRAVKYFYPQVLKMFTDKSDYFIRHEHDKRDSDGNNILAYCAMEDSEQAMQTFIVKWGCSVNSVNKKLESPLHLAAERHNLKAVKVLLNYGASVNLTDTEGETPLVKSMRSEEPGLNAYKVREALMQKGSNLDEKIKFQDGSSRTLLQVAVERNDYMLVRLLLQNGANPNVISVFPHCNGPSGTTYAFPIHQAVVGKEPEILVLLRANGANLEVRDSLGHTPLVCAVRSCRGDSVRKLMWLGAESSAKDRWGANILRSTIWKCFRKDKTCQTHILEATWSTTLHLKEDSVCDKL